MKFSGETKVNEIASRILGRAGFWKTQVSIYCCGGGKSLHEACLHADVPADEILNQLRQNSELVDPEQTQWTSRPVAELTRHIRQHHHRYVRDVSPRLRALLARIREKHGPKHPEIEGIEKLFGDVAREMIMHMQKEEQIPFPYIDALEISAKLQSSLASVLSTGAKSNSHDDAGARRCGGNCEGNPQNDRRIQGPQRCMHNLLRPCIKACRNLKKTCTNLENNILFPRTVGLEGASR